MISGLKPKRLLYKDGTGQSQRLMQALNPGFVNIDERTLSDLIGFAQQLSEELVFFNEDDQPDGNWSGFLMDRYHPDLIAGGEIDKLEKLKKNFLSELLLYIDAPGKFAGFEEKLRRFSHPHLVLFISFLQLLQNIKDQLNGLTKKHLDFYFLEVLGLNKKKPLPDVVNVTIELADNVNGLLVEKGTLLSAGKDSDGKDLTYKTDRDVTVSQARIAAIATVFVEKKVTTLKDARTNIVSDAKNAFMSMMQLALGDSEMGDKLPTYRTAEVTYSILLDKIYAALPKDDSTTDELNYVTEKLFLSKAEFKSIIAAFLNINSTDDDWEKVYGYLDHAFKEKTKRKRQQELRKVKESDAAKGFITMFEFALGDPDPTDKLPIYRGGPINIYDLLKDLGGKDESVKKEAGEYVRDELLMSETDFAFTAKMSTDSKATDQDWNKVYATLELAQRKKRKYQLPSPYTEEWLNVYAVPDAKANGYKIDTGKGESSLRFNTFGETASEGMLTVQPASIGFGISSAQLALTEGNRSITLTVSFSKNEKVNVEEIKTLTTLLSDPLQYYQPFLFFLSNSKQWMAVSPKTESLQFGDVIVNGSQEVYAATVAGDAISVTSGTPLNQNDVGKYIVLAEGSIYRIVTVTAERAGKVEPAGNAGKQPQIKKYNTGDIIFNSMRVVLELNENDPPVTAPAAANEYLNIKSTLPVIAMVLNQVPLLKEGKINPADSGRYISLYQQFKNLQLEKVTIKVEVSNLKTLLLQNDFSVLDYKKPFEPFGFNPESGNRFYFTHRELADKQLDKLNLKFQWMKPPRSFADYYKNYWKIINSNNDLKTLYADNHITDNSVFTTQINFVDYSTTISLGETTLFNKDNAQSDSSADIRISELIANRQSRYHYARSNGSITDDEVLKNKRYFSLELGHTDFQHSIYSTLLTAQAFLNPTPDPTPDPVTGKVPENLRILALNAPYIPKIKSFTVSYSASLEVNFLNPETNNKADAVYHINAFGYRQLPVSDKNVLANKTYFLPYLKNEGELYVGLSKLLLPQNLSILFQMAEGTADPDLERQPVSWSYLSNNEWQELKGTNLVADTTNGLINTGIIEFNIPADATNDNSLLSGGLHWLKATVSTNTSSISDTVDIFTQGTSATFSDNENAADHLLTLLAPETIKETVGRIKEIKKIYQPFSSSKGRPAETDTFFYNRVSERLRHKNRALTIWDYERIVLEQFPGIYKVKCIHAEFDGITTEPGRVDVIVIPDIKGRLPFNPFQPKVPAETISEIQKYLEQRTPAFATVKVRNPSYLQVKTRFAVKFKVGYNEGFFSIKLEEELKRYLSPWAYDEGADIMIGGRIYANVIVNFLAERPYVEYVAGIKLFQSKDGSSFINVRTLNKDENVIMADSPDIILVSALKHDIDIITDEGFEENDFTGINYMRIGLDFIVG